MALADTSTDLVDVVEPVMLIIGSRGLGEIKGYAK